MTVETFSTSDVDRILGLADQFLDEWAEDAVQAGRRDPDYEERAEEWKTLRPLLVAAPTLLRGLWAIIAASRRPVPLTPEDYADIAWATVAAIDDGNLKDRSSNAIRPASSSTHVQADRSVRSVVPAAREQ